MKDVFTDRSLRNLMLINFLFGASDAVFALRTVLLSSHGMSPAQIGLMFSLTSIVGTVSPLVGGWLADRVFSRYKVFLLALWGYAVVVALLPVSADIRLGAMLLAMVLMPCLQVFHPTGSTLIATCSINAVSAHKNVDYSMLRLWMSVGYTISTFIMTPVMQKFGIDAPFYIALAFLAAVWLLRGAMKENQETPVMPTEAPIDRNRLDFKGIFKNYYIVTYVLINVIYVAASNCSSYLSYVLEDRGIDLSQIGVLSSVKVCGEIVTLVLLPRMQKKISLSGLQLLAGCFLCVELLLMQYAQDLLQVCCVAMIGGMGNGICFCTAGLYVRTMAPRGLEATAHSLWMVSSSLGGILLSYVFGIVLDSYGVSANYWLALIMEASWLVLFLGTLLFGHFVLKKKNAVPMLFQKRESEA